MVRVTANPIYRNLRKRSPMNHIRNNIKRDFTTIPNALINDNELTDRARFLFCYMAAKPDDWKFYQNKISKDLKLSVETIRKYISELEESGWLSRELVRNEGKFDSYDYTLNNSPCSKNTDTVKNHDGKKPTRENLVLTNEIPLQKNTINKKEIEEPQKENELLITTKEEFEGMGLTTIEILPIIPSVPQHFKKKYDEKMQQLQKEYDQLPKVDTQEAFEKLKQIDAEIKASKKKKYIYPPTIEELIQPIYEKLIEKKRIHPNIVDCWNNANMQAEKFYIHWEEKGWKIEKLNLAISKWINNSISYGQVTKPCPIQYKGNPANAQPVPTKVHVEETKSPEQSKESRKAMFAAAKAELNHIGA